jgi:NAD(P)H-dependent FMN reductase
MKLLLLAASLREGSFNKKLINICAKYLQDKQHEIDLRQMQEFDVPLYSGDLESESGVPENAKKFSELMRAADRIIFSVPEYNYSVPGIFKNLIDWVSRIRPMPLKGLKILLISASPSSAGGRMGNLQTRIPLEGCGSFVYPGTFSLASAHTCFDDNGKLKDEKLLQRLQSLLDEYIAS